MRRQGSGEAADASTVPVIEEWLEVSTVESDKGGYRFTRHVDSHQQIVDEWLRDQRVDIERRPMAVTLQLGRLPDIRYEDDAFW